MRIQIRQGIFETNSSSTHTITLTSKPVDSVLNFFIEYYLQEKRRYQDTYVITDNIKNNIFIMPKLYHQPDIDDSSNCRCVYIYKSLASKISYIASYLWTQKFSMKYWYCKQNEYDKLQKQVDLLIEWYKKYVLSYLQKVGYYYLTEVKWDINENEEYELYKSGDCEYGEAKIDCELPEFYNIFEDLKTDITREEFDDILNKIFMDDFMIINHTSSYGAQTLELEIY